MKLLHLVSHFFAKSRSITYRAMGLSLEFEEFCRVRKFYYEKVEDDIVKVFDYLFSKMFSYQVT